MTKSELRKLYKERRTAISSHEKLKLDDLLLIQFQHLAFEEVDTLLTYWPMANQAEPNTLLFSSYMRHMIPALQIAYAVSDFTSYSMDAYAINEDTVYNTNTYGITEPANGTLLPPEAIDLVFVPMLICDEEGYRAGYGKGFYDRYLARCRPEVLKVGFSYFEPVEKIIDTQAFDVSLDYCVTPTNIYEF
ncbi:5-formyltetrahydrofolate cyclo-ligase [Filimonas lacunae]|nr:5-formyltetrahydrofolate cyclo-ligase [Filimonas lacunae]